MHNSFLFLGSGASLGVPLIGCHCSVCSSHSPYNKRLRPSGLIKFEGKAFLIDSGPDFRQQALLYKINHLDGLMLTHIHYDHIAGVGDLRPFSEKKELPCLLSRQSFDALEQQYQYLFRPPRFKFHILEEGMVEFEGIRVLCVNYEQASVRVTGFRFGDFAYISDIKDYDNRIFSALRGVKKLVLSALCKERSLVHLSFPEAVVFAERVGAHRTWLTHISHLVDHEEGGGALPDNVQIGYDGLTIEF